MRQCDKLNDQHIGKSRKHRAVCRSIRIEFVKTAYTNPASNIYVLASKMLATEYEDEFGFLYYKSYICMFHVIILNA